MECPGEASISHLQTVQQLLYTCGLDLILGLGSGVFAVASLRVVDGVQKNGVLPCCGKDSDKDKKDETGRHGA